MWRSQPIFTTHAANSFVWEWGNIPAVLLPSAIHQRSSDINTKGQNHCKKVEIFIVSWNKNLTVSDPKPWHSLTGGIRLIWFPPLLFQLESLCFNCPSIFWAGHEVFMEFLTFQPFVVRLMLHCLAAQSLGRGGFFCFEKVARVFYFWISLLKGFWH